MNFTQTVPSHIRDYYTVCTLSGVFALIAVMISCVILTLVRRTKPRLHTVRHLLICNTCVASILYCIVQNINYVYLLFLPWETSNVNCRWRAYFAYITLCAVSYSFFIQAISRLFICVFSIKRKWLVTFKAHYILMLIQWLTVIVIPLPSILTKDIYFRPNALCWVPLQATLHVSYTFIAYYLIPTSSICVIYICIYYRVQKTTARAENLIRSVSGGKRDLELLRNIMILLCIYLTGGFPALLFLLTSHRVIYLVYIDTVSLAIAVEKICTLLLDRELRQVIKGLLNRTTQIAPLPNICTAAKHREKLTHHRRTVEQLPTINKSISLQLV